MHRERLALLGAAAAAAFLVPACGDEEANATVRVFAAASLTDAFEEIAAAFEATAEGEAAEAVTVELELAGSSALREQILEGAPADVFASANESNMAQVVEADAVAGDPVVFVTNELEIAVPAGNPADVTSLTDFSRAELLVGLCAAEVPCGEVGREALAAAGVEPSVDTDEPDVRALLTKIEEGELDAGIVYRTDVLAAGDAVEGIAIPAELNVVARYPIAVLRDAEQPDAARDFVEFVLSSGGRAILERFGFGIP